MLYCKIGGMDDSKPGVPRWVKAFAVAGVVVVVLVVVMLLTGHGPSEHMR
jgi:hypothetical protein